MSKIEAFKNLSSEIILVQKVGSLKEVQELSPGCTTLSRGLTTEDTLIVADIFSDIEAQIVRSIEKWVGKQYGKVVCRMTTTDWVLKYKGTSCKYPFCSLLTIGAKFSNGTTLTFTGESSYSC